MGAIRLASPTHSCYHTPEIADAGGYQISTVCRGPNPRICGLAEDMFVTLRVVSFL